MKRLLLPVSALVLVLTACGAGAKPAPRVAEVGAHVPSVKVIAAQRERAATHEAQRLLREFVPPPGARPARQPREHAGVLRQWGPGPVGEVVDVHRFWRVHKSLGTVANFVRALRISGLARRGTGSGTRTQHYLSWSFFGETRFLNVTAVALPRSTVIRVDALVAWIYPRSPQEKVPGATREIVVRAPKSSTTVTDRAKIAQIVRWFDALPISPPGVAVSCPLGAPAHATLSFRNAGGAQLAQATVPLYPPASICNPIGFAVGGKVETPLIDHNRGASFIRRLERLLNVRFVRSRR
jgi:hypothetical protein